MTLASRGPSNQVDWPVGSGSGCLAGRWAVFSLIQVRQTPPACNAAARVLCRGASFGPRRFSCDGKPTFRRGNRGANLQPEVRA